MSFNDLMIVIALVAGLIVLISYFIFMKTRKVIVKKEEIDTLELILENLKAYMLDKVKEEYSLGLTDAEFEQLYSVRAKLINALDMCSYGVDSAKEVIKDIIKDYINKNLQMDIVDKVLGFADGYHPSDQVVFETLMHLRKKFQGKNALTKWIEDNGFDNPKLSTHAEDIIDNCYYVTPEELWASYQKEMTGVTLTIDDKQSILATILFQMYQGFGVIDTIREMDINGLNFGTSGKVLDAMEMVKENGLSLTNSVWLYHKGKFIHLRFIKFESENEMKRVVRLLVRWGNPGPLTDKRGYIVNTMYDKSRVTAFRPSASECWAAFVRKFTISDVTPEYLYAREGVTNSKLVLGMIEYLVRAMTNMGITGRQGSGKTTFMTSLVRYLPPVFNIRTLELAMELYLRELYPSRNILAVHETPTVKATELQDTLKKSDAAISIVGEVASATMAARMIEFGQVASLVTLFTHHANRTKDLVISLRNALVKADNFTEDTAEKDVTDLIKIDIHLDYTPSGERYIERITEIIQLPETVPYPNIDERNIPLSQINILKEWAQRTTNREGFYTQDIIRYNLLTKTYEVVNRPSPWLEEAIRKNLTTEGNMRARFELFIRDNFPRRTKEELERYSREAVDGKPVEDWLMKTVDGYSQEFINQTYNIVEQRQSFIEGMKKEESVEDTALFGENITINDLMSAPESLVTSINTDAFNFADMSGLSQSMLNQNISNPITSEYNQRQQKVLEEIKTKKQELGINDPNDENKSDLPSGLF